MCLWNYEGGGANIYNMSKSPKASSSNKLALLLCQTSFISFSLLVGYLVLCVNLIDKIFPARLI